MSEQIRTRGPSEGTPPPGGGLGTVWPDEQTGELVQVGTGLYMERLPVAGRSIEDIRETFADRLDIDPGSQAVVDGQVVTDESTRIQPGQRLAFVRHAGEKGIVPEACTVGGLLEAVETITVVTGLYSELFPVSGEDTLLSRTVAGIRARLRDRLDIPARSSAIVNGDVVTDETNRTLVGGDRLVFVRDAGEMG